MKHISTLSAVCMFSVGAAAQPNCEQIIQAAFTPIVQGSTVVFNNGSFSQFPDATTFYWLFGDGDDATGNIVTHIYDEPGTYTACLYAMVENCVDTVCQQIVIGGGDPCLSLADIVINLVPYQNGVSFAYGNVPGNANITWYFDDGGSSGVPQGFHEYAEPGEYTICLWTWFIVDGTSDTCSTQVCETIVIAGGNDPCDGLQAGFFANVSPDGVQFSNATTGTGFQTSWFWSFGDGGTSDDAQPYHAYGEPGPYLVCLTAVSVYEQLGGGLITCADTICDEMVVPGGGSPCDSLNAGFTVEVDGQVAFFENALNSNLYSYYWTFGDGSSDYGPDPVHTFAEPGEYHVCLLMWAWDPDTQDTCFADHCEWVNILAGSPCDSLSASFDASVAGLGVNFQNAQIAPNTSYTWTFGDGSWGDGPNPFHQYNGPGEYLVCLVVGAYDPLTQDSCFADHCAWINVGNGDPCGGFVAEFGWDPIGGGTVVFNGSSAPPAIGYQWFFGDGSSGDGMSVTHTYTGPGPFHVCLVAWYWNEQLQDTCWAETCQWIEPGGDPCDGFTAEFDWEPQGGNTISFVSSTDPPALAYIWNFGDGSGGGGSSITHTFPEPGEYHVCFTAWYWNQQIQDTCWAENCQWIFVGGGDPCDSLQANFVWEPAGQGTIYFQDVSTTNGLDVGYWWSFGDNTYGDGPNPAHTYALPGQYEVCLTVYTLNTPDSCSSTTCQWVVAVGGGSPCDLLSAEFSAAAAGFTASFQAGSNPPGTTYEWIFGDGTTGDGANTTHTYLEPGVYTVCLIVGNYDPLTQDSCFADHCSALTIIGNGAPCDSLWNASFEVSQQGPLFIFYNTSSTQGTPVSVHWTMGDGGQGDGSPFTYIYEDPGVYTACLTITGVIPGTNDTCSLTTCETIEVPVGIDDPQGETLFSAWPQPFSGSLHIGGSLLNGPVRCALFDMTGRLIDDRGLQARGTTTLDYSILPPGAYVLRLRTAETERALRVVKQ